jgi:hypothetical protein
MLENVKARQVAGFTHKRWASLRLLRAPSEELSLVPKKFTLVHDKCFPSVTCLTPLVQSPSYFCRAWVDGWAVHERKESQMAIKMWIRGGAFAIATTMVIAASAESAWAAGGACGFDGSCPSGEHCEGGRIVGPPPGVHVGGNCRADPVNPIQAPATKFNPTLVSIGKIFYEFAVSSDNMHVLYTFWKLGGGSQGWYDLGSPTTDTKAATGPAAAAYGTEDNYYIFVTVAGSDGKIYLNQGFHANWVGWQ